jgi:ribosome assembly protein YihI (activator of Der GTPase)
MRVFPPAQGSFVELKSQQREHQPKLGSLLVVPLVISPVASVASTHPSLDHGA